jgi:hypothetical protein
MPNKSSVIGSGRTENQHDQGQQAEGQLNVTAIDFLGKEHERSEFVFHGPPLVV